MNVRLFYFMCLVLAFTGINASAQRQVTKELWVLFPLSKDVELVTVVVDDNKRFIYNGDIVIDPSQVVTDTSGRGARKVDEELRRRRLIYRQGVHLLTTQNANDNWNLWPDNVIPYEIDDEFNAEVRQRILDAIYEINNETNLRLRQRVEGDKHWVNFVPALNDRYQGTSFLGRQFYPGQKIWLQNDTNLPKGTVIHEILHSAGFIHEHNRPDRDEHINIIWRNVHISDKTNFVRSRAGITYTEYDYGSIMHYGETSGGKFDRNGVQMQTMETIPPGIPIGQNRGLSPLDIEGVNAVYTRFLPARPRSKFCADVNKVYCPYFGRCIERSDKCPER